MFAAGDRIVVKRNDFRLGVANGERGRVVAVDDDAVTVELRGRAVRLDARFLDDRTPQGDPTLVHGYAITGHVAQGLTVDRAFVLADDGLSREWGYTAMSRGRLANHVYVADDPTTGREEFAPAIRPPQPAAAPRRGVEPQRGGGARDRRVRGDTTLADLDARLAVATRRSEIERQRWRPGRRRRLAEAREAEAGIAERVEEERRRRYERGHASKGGL